MTYKVFIDIHYGQKWIVFDRDEINDFDDIITEAKENNIYAAWSNPCIEIWFYAYFGRIPSFLNSSKCCESFSRTFFRKTGHTYDKADNDIYSKLKKYGDELKAITIVKNRHNKFIENNECNPSNMNPCSTLYILIQEILNAVKEV